ncbi:MAG: putative tRNA sulfurtransferase [Bacillota bacterium]|jgi:thiamine biosynthesis protein ThiI
MRYGELTLKGKNRHLFENKLARNILAKLKGFPPVKLTKTSGRMFLDLQGQDLDALLAVLNNVFGLSSFSPAICTGHDISEIEKKAAQLLQSKLTQRSSFKLVTRRSLKTFSMLSSEINNRVGKFICSKLGDTYVDVHEPDVTLYIEVRKEHTYLYTDIFKGRGGLTVGISGPVLLLLSGGIDSPVAGYLALKRGVELSCVYFHSHPFTGGKVKQKVIDLVHILNNYGGCIKLYIIPFTETQLKLREKCRPSYTVTIMRRMMMRMATALAHEKELLALITGESLGQVASQTLESLNVINEVTNLPILRPLIGMDKIEIVNRAKYIGTYETSILPYDDCCTLFLPKSPKIRPTRDEVNSQESFLNIDELVSRALANVEVKILDPSQGKVNIDLDCFT